MRLPTLAPAVLLLACTGASDGGAGPGDGAPGSDDATAGETTSDVGAGDAGTESAIFDTDAPEHGLRGEYFDDFDDPRVVRTDPTIDFDWSKEPIAGVPHDWFSVRWSGELSIDKAATYTFETLSDDGVRLLVDGKPVIENWTAHFATKDVGTVALTAGPHAIRLEYFQADLASAIHLYWSAPGLLRAIVPAAVLRPAGAASTERAPAPPYVNPVVRSDCPDPGVLAVVEASRPAYYMTCTGGPLHIRRSRDLVRWVDTGASILPSGKAPWSANGGRNWAPEIHAVGSGFVAYFTAVDGADRLAIGVASASKPTGPWTVTAAPLVDDPTPGVIDPTFFRDDDGKQFLYWKRDGNAIGAPTPIFARALAADGLTFAPGSSATEVLTNDPSSWEGGVVEAPWVVKNGGSYYLFYSGNVYDQRYRTGVARASAPLGPFTKHGAPLLVNDATFVGPGHGSVVAAHGADFWVYHAWLNDGAGGATASAGREVLVDRIAWTAGWPKIHDGTPSDTPMPWP